jgi:hypothetical protein
MLKTSTIVIMFAVLMPHLSLQAATPVYKCTNMGLVTFQSVPCSSGPRRDDPSVEKLNAERQKKLRESGSAPPALKSSAPGGELSPPTSGASWSSSPSEQTRPQTVVAPSASPNDTFKCDGRTLCSQMTSCAEAKYFLNRCPGVKMDGDGDGIPCENQWCNK